MLKYIKSSKSKHTYKLVPGYYEWVFYSDGKPVYAVGDVSDLFESYDRDGIMEVADEVASFMQYDSECLKYKDYENCNSDAILSGSFADIDFVSDFDVIKESIFEALHRHYGD